MRKTHSEVLDLPLMSRRSFTYWLRGKITNRGANDDIVN